MEDSESESEGDILDPIPGLSSTSKKQINLKKIKQKKEEVQKMEKYNFKEKGEELHSNKPYFYTASPVTVLTGNQKQITTENKENYGKCVITLDKNDDDNNNDDDDDEEEEEEETLPYEYNFNSSPLGVQPISPLPLSPTSPFGKFSLFPLVVPNASNGSKSVVIGAKDLPVKQQHKVCRSLFSNERNIKQKKHTKQNKPKRQVKPTRQLKHKEDHITSTTKDDLKHQIGKEKKHKRKEREKIQHVKRLNSCSALFCSESSEEEREEKEEGEEGEEKEKEIEKKEIEKKEKEKRNRFLYSNIKRRDRTKSNLKDNYILTPKLKKRRPSNGGNRRKKVNSKRREKSYIKYTSSIINNKGTTEPILLQLRRVSSPVKRKSSSHLSSKNIRPHHMKRNISNGGSPIIIDLSSDDDNDSKDENITHSTTTYSPNVHHQGENRNSSKRKKSPIVVLQPIHEKSRLSLQFNNNSNNNGDKEKGKEEEEEKEEKEEEEEEKEEDIDSNEEDDDELEEPKEPIDDITQLYTNMMMNADYEQEISQPSNLHVELLPYQRSGVHWMIHREENGDGGILADAMGLGKTIQTLCLILCNRQKNSSQTKTTLIVCQLSTLNQWREEIRKATGTQLSVLAYYGKDRIKDPTWLARHDIILTTFSTLSSDYVSSGLSKKKPGVLQKIKWYRIVLDEAHLIKNAKTKCAQAACGLGAHFRWCLTGTPIQNSIDDCYGLFHFLRLENFLHRWWWDTFIQTPAKRSDPKAFSRLQSVLSSVMLRRTREHSIKGKPIVNLPKCDIRIEYITASPVELRFYRGLFLNAQSIFRSYVEQDAVSQNFMHILELLLRLRQCCVHPLIVLLSTLGKRPSLPSVLSNGGRTREKVMKDALIHTINILGAKTSNLEDESNSPFEFTRDELGDLLSNEAGNKTLNLLRSKAAVELATSPIKHTSVSSLSTSEHKTFADICGICMDDLSLPRVEALCCKMQFCQNCIEGLLKDNMKPECPGCKQPISPTQFISIDYKESDSISSFDNNISFLNKSQKMNKEEEEMIVRCCVMSSSKVRVLLKDLKEIGIVEPDTKSLIFSQFTRTLDLLELALTLEGIKHTRLDGSMSKSQRIQSIRKFKSDPTIKVFLISLKAGAYGLNLIEASRVYLMDPWWNPSTEQQALDRVHRIGQMKPVTVLRYIIKDSIEEKILELQDRKKAIVRGTFGGSGASIEKVSKLGLKELGILFE